MSWLLELRLPVETTKVPVLSPLSVSASMEIDPDKVDTPTETTTPSVELTTSSENSEAPDWEGNTRTRSGGVDGYRSGEIG